MPPRQVDQKDLEPGKRYYIISDRRMRFYAPFRFDTGGRNYDDPVLGPVACEKWVGTFMMNKYIGWYIDSHFSDVDCIGKQWRWNENENEFTEYRDSVIHIGLKKFDCEI